MFQASRLRLFRLIGSVSGCRANGFSSSTHAWLCFSCRFICRSTATDQSGSKTEVTAEAFDPKEFIEPVSDDRFSVGLILCAHTLRPCTIVLFEGSDFPDTMFAMPHQLGQNLKYFFQGTSTGGDEEDMVPGV